MPYIYTEAAHAAASGNPLMRPMFLEFGDDDNVYDNATQYMFGPNILVAPIFNDQGKAHFYLPSGKWTSILDGKVYQAPRTGEWVNEVFDELDLPVLVRQNSIIVRNEKAVHAAYDYTKDVDIHLYQIQDGNVSSKVVDEHGQDAAEIKVERSNGHLSLIHISEPTRP